LSVTLKEEQGLRVLSVNRVMRGIFAPNREEMARGCRRLHNEEHHNLYASSIIRVIKLMRMGWACHVTCLGEEKCVQNFGWKS
jgi:hypothetical protein